MASQVARLAQGAARRFGAHGVAMRLAPVHSRVRAERGVALTFDDGPDPVYTPLVLDALAESGARATFFLVGRHAERHPDVVARIAAEGHALGSHSYSHRDGWTLSFAELVRDYRTGRSAVEGAAGRSVGLFRPPKGWWVGRTALATRLAGMTPWLWTVEPEDWRPGVTAEAILARTDGLRAGDVIVMHDAIAQGPAEEDRSATVAALPSLLARARPLGLEWITLPSPADERRQNA